MLPYTKNEHSDNNFYNNFDYILKKSLLSVFVSLSLSYKMGMLFAVVYTWTFSSFIYMNLQISNYESKFYEILIDLV